MYRFMYVIVSEAYCRNQWLISCSQSEFIAYLCGHQLVRVPYQVDVQCGDKELLWEVAHEIEEAAEFLPVPEAQQQSEENIRMISRNGVL
jgi:hypothetical protein